MSKERFEEHLAKTQALVPAQDYEDARIQQARMIGNTLLLVALAIQNLADAVAASKGS